MHSEPKRINVTLDAEQAAKLTLMAQRTHLQEGTLARSLLSVAIDAASPDESHIHMILDSIPEALERAQTGSREIRAGEGVSIEDL